MENQENSRFFSMFETAVEGLWIMDTNGKVSFYNHTFYQQFELDLNDTRIDDWIALIHPMDKDMFSNRVDEHMKSDEDNERVYTQYRVKKNDGTYCWIEGTGVVKQDSMGSYMVGNHRDISKQKLMESYIRRLAYYDKSSGLPNNDKLKQDITDKDSNFVLIHIYLSKLKPYVNQYGEELIGEMLKWVTSSMSVFEECKCELYRNSLDTFSVLISSAITEQYVAKMCQKFISTFRNISSADGKLYAGDVYLGAYPCTDASMPADEVISWSAQTCEYAECHEPGHWAVCNPLVQKKVERFFFVENNIESAIQQGHISIKVQPIVCANTFQTVSFEALARWNRSTKGEIYPDEFIPVAERKGLIDILGQSVLKQSCEFISEYNKRWNTSVTINVNVSVLQLLGGQFPQQAAEIARSYDVSPANIMLELTESVLLEDKYQAMSQLRQLNVLGFNLSMDDFGSGHSSITGFFRLPFKQMKIDRSFAIEAIKSQEPFSYLKFINEMNQGKNVSVTVEGIENRQMLEALQPVGVNAFQGYFFARPMKTQDALNLNNNESLLPNLS